MVAAAVVFLQIAFGVALADIVMSRVFGAPPVAFGSRMPVWTEPMAHRTVVPGAMVLLGAHPRDALPITIASAAGYYAARIGSGLLGPELGAAIGAFALARQAIGVVNGDTKVNGVADNTTVANGNSNLSTGIAPGSRPARFGR
jgi:hypothetical protein